MYCSGKSKFHGARVLNARNDFDSFVRKGLRDINTLSRIGLSNERSRDDENGQNGGHTLEIKFQNSAERRFQQRPGEAKGEKSGTRVSRDYRTVLPDLIDVAVVNPLRALKGYDVVFVPSKCPSDSTQVGSGFSD